MLEKFFRILAVYGAGGLSYTAFLADLRPLIIFRRPHEGFAPADYISAALFIVLIIILLRRRKK